MQEKGIVLASQEPKGCWELWDSSSGAEPASFYPHGSLWWSQHTSTSLTL